MFPSSRTDATLQGASQYNPTRFRSPHSHSARRREAPEKRSRKQGLAGMPGEGQVAGSLYLLLALESQGDRHGTACLQQQLQ